MSDLVLRCRVIIVRRRLADGEQMSVMVVFGKQVCEGGWQMSYIRAGTVIAKFHYTGPTGPDQTKSADFVGDPGLRPGLAKKSARVRSGPCSGI